MESLGDLVASSEYAGFRLKRVRSGKRLKCGRVASFVLLCTHLDQAAYFFFGSRLVPEPTGAREQSILPGTDCPVS